MCRTGFEVVAVASCGGWCSSLEAVEDLALHAMLELAPPQHELQNPVDGVLRVLLQDTGRDAGECLRGGPKHPCSQGTLQPSQPTPGS